MKCVFGVTGCDASARYATGRRAVEALARELNVTLQFNATIGARVGRITLSSGELLLVIPEGELAQNGNVWAAMANQYALQPTDTLVVYDEVDMPFGLVDLSRRPVTTAQPGVVSIAQQANTPAAYLRIGTQSTIQGCLPDDIFSSVPFSASGVAELEADIIPRAIDAIHEFVTHSV